MQYRSRAMMSLTRRGISAACSRSYAHRSVSSFESSELRPMSHMSAAPMYGVATTRPRNGMATGDPAGARSTSCETRSGATAAYETALAPPIECPTTANFGGNASRSTSSVIWPTNTDASYVTFGIDERPRP
eukprot:Amastigsp_a183537_9.p4 type:complete len:132 gc:universal Amastigsp_a183537_9:316-711(+)